MYSFAGYRDAVDELMRRTEHEPVSVPLMLWLHRQIYLRVYESKHAYYAALRQSQERWVGGAHTIWPWTTYLIRVLADAYDDFEQRVAAGRASQGLTKQERVREHVLHVGPSAFRLRDLRRALPGISDQTFRLALGQLRDEGRVSVDGAGPGATWTRRGG
jgi:hypothetical protein